MRRVFFWATFAVVLALLVAQPRAWTFAELLHPPSPDELRLVDESWARKTWNLGGTSRIGTTTVPVGSLRFDAHLYSFNLNGSPRCGAVLLPPGAANVPLAGLVDIGDIRWDYPDRDLTNGPYVAGILGERARDFALIVPCARGMGLRIGELASRAGGDRRDAWEGAAEDAMAFLTVALSETRQIDPARVGVYGYSRGGGVALIAGERDPRFKNQFLDWFMRGREALPLAELRRRVAAASPLYFVEHLPPFQIHQGEADVAVPVRNATALRERVSAANAREIFIYPGAGHMLDDTGAAATARAFLLRHLN